MPPELRQPMDVFARALRIGPFLPTNRLNPNHGSSVFVKGRLKGPALRDRSGDGCDRIVGIQWITIFKGF